MPRPKTNLPLTNNPYNSIRRNEDFYREGNDCSIQAVAVVCGVLYEEAHKVCSAHGYKAGDGMHTYEIERAVEALGFKLKARNTHDFIAQYPGVHSSLQNVTTHHPHRFNKVWADDRTYLFYTKGHVAAVVDGVNGDWCRRKSLRVYRIVEVINPGV